MYFRYHSAFIRTCDRYRWKNYFPSIVAFLYLFLIWKFKVIRLETFLSKNVSIDSESATTFTHVDQTHSESRLYGNLKITKDFWNFQKILGVASWYSKQRTQKLLVNKITFVYKKTLSGVLQEVLVKQF